MLAVVAVVAALLPVAEPAAPAAAKGDAFITAQTAGILTIEGGECFSDPFHSPSAGQVIVIYTPCDKPVDNQAYGFLHADDGRWDRAVLAEFAWTGCARGFAHYWPGDAAGAGTALDFYPILPTEETWADGDRDIMCVVYNRVGRLPGSMLPAAR